MRMNDSVAASCCGRPMSVIGVDRAAGALQLHSCASCGRHCWRDGDREVDRSELLETLRVVKEPAMPRPAATRRERPADEAGRRAELERLLSGFTVHGTTS